jgi:cobalt-precorrin 5A hydrolase/precorrin-3B C17-methyltransferase
MITNFSEDKCKNKNWSKIYWYPPILWVGIGCQLGTSKKLIEFAIKHTFETHNLALEFIGGIATIDLKGNEVGILELCREYNYPLLTFTSDILRKIDVPNPSKIVNKKVKNPSVAEAACLAAASKFNLVKKTVNDNLLVSKQIVKIEGEKGAVTIAVAIAETYNK